MFNETVLTKKGIALNNKVQAGYATIEYLRVGLGKGTYEKNEKLEDQENLKEEKQSVPISSIKIIDEKTVKLRVVINNEGITEGYDITEIGLYATDPDEGEILYSVANATEGKADYQPSKTEVVDYQITIDLYSTVSNSNNVTIKLDTGAVALAADLIQLKEDMSQGDISENVIETLDTVEDKYPVPAAGESVKRFFGKVLTFLRNIRPLTGDINIFISANAGSDITGDGSESNPYASIGKALGTISKDLGGYTAAINISDGTYDEDVIIKGISNGYIRLQRNGAQELNDLCNVKSVRVENCNSVSISGLNLTTTDASGIFGTRTDFINVSSCQSVSSASAQVSFNFDYVSVVRVSGNRSLNHNMCLRAYASDVYSEYWSSDSIGNYGIFLEGSGRLSKGNTFQPRGTIADENTQSGSIISSKYGARIGSLSINVNLYVATTGSDTTGDGTSAKPFKTIQHAIDILPKDLGGYTASITIASGTYVEDLNIIDFGNSGFLMLLLSGNVTVGHVMLSGSFLIINSTGGVRSLSVTSLTVMNGSNLNAWGDINITTTGNRSIPTVGDNYSIIVIRGSIAYMSGATTITGNTYTGLRVHSLSKACLNTLSGNGLTVGVAVETGSMFTCYYSNISATTKFYQDRGGMIINSNGTQISDDITTGLSCTWGTTYGSYYRHGNSVGKAQVIVNFRVTTTTPLTAGTAYSITGCPAPALTAYSTIAVMCHAVTITRLCSMDIYGTIAFTPDSNVPVNTTFIFSCTYITNS